MSLNRRELLTAAGGVALGSLSHSQLLAAASTNAETPKMQVRYCLNTSTIREQKLPLEEIVDLVADAGYDGIEPWLREIEEYVAAGKSLADLRKRIADRGLRVESAIGFAKWIVDDPAERAAGLEQMKHDMELVAAIGGTHIAAPPVGMHGGDAPAVDLLAAAERYRAVLDLGRETGVIPQVEVWGFSKNLSRLGEAMLVAIEAGHPDACLLPDVYHIFKGGSDFQGLSLLSAQSMHCFHFNDYPATPPRAEMNDSHRVYPGEGVAPWEQIIGILREMGYQGVASLELFNREYWKQDPKLVLTTGLTRMQEVFGSN